MTRHIEIECERCMAAVRVRAPAKWYRCLRCGHEGTAEDAEHLAELQED